MFYGGPAGHCPRVLNSFALKGLQQYSIYYNITLYKHNQFGINNSVVRGSGIPNYSNAYRSDQHEYLFTQTFAQWVLCLRIHS